MATQITVAVGANGEVLGAASMRQGARADRLDSEATRKQARQAVGEAQDDDLTGRENKKGEHDPSRDPAAFSRKKKAEKAEGDFLGLSIEFTYHPLPNTKWPNARDLKYMEIKVQGFAEDGSKTEQQIITLNRNLNHDAFVATPENRDWDVDLVQRTRHSGAYSARGEHSWPAETSFFNNTWWVQPGTKFAVDYLEQSKNVAQWPGYEGLTYEDWTRVFSDFLERRFFEFNYEDVIGPLDGSTAFNQWERFTGRIFIDGETYYNFNRAGYPTEAENFNINQNSRTQLDDKVSKRFGEQFDPVYELFILPYTSQKSFLLVTYTDYMIYDDSFYVSACNATTEFSASADYRVFVSGMSFPTWYTGYVNNIYLRRFRPTYHIPDGWRINGFDHETLEFTPDGGGFVGGRPLPVITEKGSQVIQQVHLYAITDGVVSKVEEVPQELRDVVGNLSTNLKNQIVDSSRSSSVQSYSRYEAEQDYSNPDRADPQRYAIEGYVDGSDNWTLADPGLYMMRDTSLADKISDARKYLANQTRSRSMPKGYGFGRLASTNHFDCPNVGSSVKGFADDFFFTPAVYAYIKGQGNCSTTYEGNPGVAGITEFADYDTDRVRFTATQPNSILTSHAGPYGPWAPAPLLRDSTHRSWNWGRPDVCWDELTSLGFGKDLIGTRPVVE